MAKAVYMRDLVKRYLADERGATAIEYGLTCMLLAVVIISALTSLGTKISTDFSKVGAAL
jgi:pilus assembly protein Flp/PilA